MTTKAYSFKMDEADLLDMKNIAAMFNMSSTDLIKNAINEYISKLKKDPYYRLTSGVKEASKEESNEILREIESLSEDDLSISTIKRFNK